MQDQVTEVNNEARAYEFAFHILPTVAEAEVSSVTDALKSHITAHEGVIFDNEAPKRIELAYEIDKATDGTHKRYHSAYFGWMRLRISAEGLAALKEELAHMPELLRILIVKLTPAEEAHPFRYHEATRKRGKKQRGEEGEQAEGSVEAPVDDATEPVAEPAEAIAEPETQE